MTAASKKNGGRLKGKSGGRVSPLRASRIPVMLVIVAVAVFLVGDVYLNVQRVRFGSDIQELKKELDVLGSDVRDLEGMRAGMTSLAAIEQQARDMGMVYPKRLPRTLVVEVPAGEVPPVWSLPSPRSTETYTTGGARAEVAMASANASRGR
ncbi:hypothetical protein KQI63_00340 [bacterium]|nr:hypothetical protein [bacterium]